jgi:cutinase
MLPAATMAKVNSVVIFGDPDKGQALPGANAANVLTVCHTGDQICAGQAVILQPHLTYSQDAKTSAAFVVSKSGLA